MGHSRTDPILGPSCDKKGLSLQVPRTAFRHSRTHTQTLYPPLGSPRGPYPPPLCPPEGSGPEGQHLGNEKASASLPGPQAALGQPPSPRQAWSRAGVTGRPRRKKDAPEDGDSRRSRVTPEAAAPPLPRRPPSPKASTRRREPPGAAGKPAPSLPRRLDRRRSAGWCSRRRAGREGRQGRAARRHSASGPEGRREAAAEARPPAAPGA